MPMLYSGGERWPFGSYSRKEETRFDGGNLPAWLTAVNGTTAESTNSPQGGASGIGGITISGHVNKRIDGPSIDLTDQALAAVSLTVVWTPMHAAGGVFFGFEATGGTATAAGGGVFQVAGAGNSAELQAYNEGATTSLDAGAALRPVLGMRQNLTVTLTAHDGLGRDMPGLHFALQGVEMAGNDFPDDLALGTVRPRLRWQGVPTGNVDHIHYVALERVWI